MNITVKNRFSVNLANPTYALENPQSDGAKAKPEQGELKDGMDFAMHPGASLTLYFDDPVDPLTRGADGKGISFLENRYFEWASSLAPEDNRLNRAFKESPNLDVHDIGIQYVNGESKKVFVVRPKEGAAGKTPVNFAVVMSGSWGNEEASGSRFTITAGAA